METIYTSAGAGVPVIQGYKVNPLQLSSTPASGEVALTEESISNNVDRDCYTFTYTCQVQAYDGSTARYTKYIYSASVDITLVGKYLQVTTYTQTLVAVQ